jgi:predicted nuclease of predicted toxin-antitoxin system
VRIFVDENVPGGVVNALRDAGHDVAWGCDFDVGAADLVRMAWALQDNRIILTEDGDFSELIFKDRMPAVGLILIKLHGFKRNARITRVVAAMAEIGDGVVGAVSVIEPLQVRRIGLPTQT